MTFQSTADVQHKQIECPSSVEPVHCLLASTATSLSDVIVSVDHVTTQRTFRYLHDIATTTGNGITNFAEDAIVHDKSPITTSDRFTMSLISRMPGTEQCSISGCQLERSFREGIHLELALVLEVNALDVADQPGTRHGTVFYNTITMNTAIIKRCFQGLITLCMTICQHCVISLACLSSSKSRFILNYTL